MITELFVDLQNPADQHAGNYLLLIFNFLHLSFISLFNNLSFEKYDWHNWFSEMHSHPYWQSQGAKL